MITLGPFAVGRDGTLSPRSPGIRPSLRFAWRGRVCEALLTNGDLRLRAVAGRIPSSADPDSDRAGTWRALAALPPELPEGWQLQLTADHRLALEMQMPAGETAVALLGDMVRFALAMDPYLDRLEAAGA